MSTQHQASAKASSASNSSSPATKKVHRCGICQLGHTQIGDLTRHVQLIHNVVQFQRDYLSCGEKNENGEICVALRQSSTSVNGRGPNGRPTSGRKGREEHHKHAFTAHDRVHWRPQPENNRDMFAVFPTMLKWQNLARENPDGLGESEVDEAKRAAKSKAKTPEYLSKLNLDRAYYAERDHAAQRVSGGLDSLSQQGSDFFGPGFSQEGGQMAYMGTGYAMAPQGENLRGPLHPHILPSRMGSMQNPQMSFPPSLPSYNSGFEVGALSGPTYRGSNFESNHDQGQFMGGRDYDYLAGTGPNPLTQPRIFPSPSPSTLFSPVEPSAINAGAASGMSNSPGSLENGQFTQHSLMVDPNLGYMPCELDPHAQMPPSVGPMNGMSGSEGVYARGEYEATMYDSTSDNWLDPVLRETMGNEGIVPMGMIETSDV